MSKNKYSILVTGGAGYIGSVLCPRLISLGHDVTVLDTMFFGNNFGSELNSNSRFSIVEGDIRNYCLIDQVLRAGKFDRVIHLAAISNDPCSDLDEELTTSVNLEATNNLMHAAKKHGIKRFIYASSASVYGIKDTKDVNETLLLEPITLYAKYKARGEVILNNLIDDQFEGVSVRAATVCGFSPRLRLDLTVNIFTYQAVCEGKVRVFGGSQMRPNIHIQDLVEFYVSLLDAPNVSGQAYNVSHSNSSVKELAELAVKVTDQEASLEVEESNDNRSYHLSSERAQRELGFFPKFTIEDAIASVEDALKSRIRIPDPTAKVYRNVQYMCENLGAWKI
ncbi:NAD(P)-dependent oxidoreductase [Aliikangiella sp. G2MR2-5]|uniref:NAD-dependent epimerase/dehydratase family protein n=1 Tax=Aliikangiella sp. G2MR2-5 TaxID=2788943 RepID=UPI0018AC1938|nr:SDR family oxidoreductase [Aliikangiella sp. G2MR2-5]